MVYYGYIMRGGNSDSGAKELGFIHQGTVDRCRIRRGAVEGYKPRRESRKNQ